MTNTRRTTLSLSIESLDTAKRIQRTIADALGVKTSLSAVISASIVAYGAKVEKAAEVDARRETDGV